MAQFNLFEFTHAHKLTGEKLRIKKVYGGIASCYIETPYFSYGKEIYIDTIVCDLDNLIKIS